jgi:DMSO reductase family type II enzyme molybdopterin subunit
VAVAMEERRGEQRYRERLGGATERVSRVTHCVDCMPTGCPLLAYVRDGVVVREEAAADVEPVEDGVPDMNPMVCQKGLAWSRQLDAPDRLLHPLRRAGARGEGHWERITWDEALTQLADGILDAIEEVGPEAVVHEGTPEIGVVVPSTRFMRVLGGTLLDVDGSINDFWAGFHQVLGKFYFTPSIDDTFHADCIFIWHSNPAYTQIPAFHYMVEARYRGAHVVLISPDVSPSHTHADLHVPVRHGTDAALAMSQTVLAENLADLHFVAEQTDLSLLVRRDTGRYLRERDLTPDGRDDRFFHAHPQRGVVAADPASLSLDFMPRLDGAFDVDLADGTRVEVEPLFARLRRRLDDKYTPEAVAEICGTHPETVRALARLAARGATRILPAAGITKYFHGDLMARAMLLLLALCGSWGKKGAGTSGWATGLFDGQTIAMSKTKPGADGAAQVLTAMDSATAALRDADPSLTGELAHNELWRQMGQAAGMVPPAFFWYRHAGFRSRWDDSTGADPTMPRTFAEYFDEAVESGWWGAAADPAADRPPRVLLEIAGNTLRRTRGGQRVLLEHLWPQLRTIAVIDVRMSQTALYADLVLPATQHYEKVGFGMATPWTMLLSFSDAAVAPPGETRSEWDILASLCRVLTEHAAARGLDSYSDAHGVTRRYADLWDEYTLGGTLVDDESVADEMVRDATLAGSLPRDTSLATLRERGWSRYSDWGVMTMAQGQASPFPVHETHAPLRNHVELGHPYPTLTRRAQFLLDHIWYVEAGEDLPVHKDPPPMGGNHPFRLSSGHNRWSIHAMNTTNPVLLETHRRKPFVLVNDRDAADRGITDDAPVQIWNDVGEFTVAARVSPAQRPGALTVYNGFEAFMFPGGKGPNEVEPGLVKWLHLAGGYGHLTYTPTEWQPAPADRCVFVGLARAPEQP